MKKFLLRFLLFNFLVLILFGALYLLPRSENYQANNYMAAMIDKHERINSLKGSQKILVAGGSNIAFGINSEMLETELGIPTVNMGLHVGLGLKFILEELKNNAEPDDIVVLSPEYFMHLNGSKDLLEHTYEIYPMVENYLQEGRFLNKFFYHYSKTKQKCLSYFTNSNKNQTKIARQYSRDMFTEQGDFIHDALNYSRNEPLKVKKKKHAKYKYWEGIDLLNDFHEIAKEKNISIFYFFPPLHESFYHYESKRIVKLIADMESQLSIPVLNNHLSCIYPDEMFLDTKYHLTSEGSKKRTEVVINGLKQAFKGDTQLQTANKEGNQEKDLTHKFSGKKTKGGLRLVNGVLLTKQKMPINVPDDGLQLNGFAIDKPNNGLASKVFFVIGEKEFASKSYGIPKKGVSKGLGGQYLKSGFNEKIPKSEIPKGLHEVKLKVVSSTEDVFYIINTKLKINN